MGCNGQCCCNSMYGCLPILGFVVLLVLLGALGLIGVLAFYIGYQICLLIPQLAIPPIPSGIQFLSFSAFGSSMSTSFFLPIVSAILYPKLRTPTDPINEYERLRRRYRKCRYAAFALIFLGPFWGGAIGAIGWLKDLNKKLSSGLEMEFWKGVLVGVIGGTVFLSALGGLWLVWTMWRRVRLSMKFDEQARKRVDVKPSAKEVRKGVDIEQPTEKVTMSLSVDVEPDVELGQSKDSSDGPPSNFIFE